MAYANKIQYGDSASLTAFSRLRVAEVASLFDSTLQYNISPNFWQSVVAVGGTAAAVANQSACLLTVTSSTNSSVIRQTYKYLRYQPGQSQLILMTGVMGAVVSKVTKHIGYFDDQNGVGFYQDGTNTGIFERSYTGGSAVDTLVAQASWNVDKFDGTGPSGVTLDFSKSQIFVIDLQWLGTGRVRYGFDLNGTIYYCHYTNHANSLTSVYMTSANLPLRYDIKNAAGGAGATMTQICTSVQSEGGVQLTGSRDFTCGNGITTINVTTRRAILTIRPLALFNSIANRSDILVQSFNLYAGSNVFWELVWSGGAQPVTLGGSPSFNAVNSGSGGSAVEFDVAGTTVTGGITIASGYQASGAAAGQSLDVSAENFLPFTLDYAGSLQNMLSLVITSITGTAACAGTFSWEERR